VNFIDDVDLEATLRGGEIDLVAQLANVIHARIGGGVNLDQVQETTFIDRNAVRAVVAGTFFERVLQTVDPFCQQTSARGFASTSGSGKEVSMPDAVGRDRVFESLNDVILSNNLIPKGGSPGAVKCLSHSVYPLRYRELCVFIPLAVKQGQHVAARP